MFTHKVKYGVGNLKEISSDFTFYGLMAVFSTTC